MAHYFDELAPGVDFLYVMCMVMCMLEEDKKGRDITYGKAKKVDKTDLPKASLLMLDPIYW